MLLPRPQGDGREGETAEIGEAGATCTFHRPCFLSSSCTSTSTPLSPHHPFRSRLIRRTTTAPSSGTLACLVSHLARGVGARGLRDVDIHPVSFFQLGVVSAVPWLPAFQARIITPRRVVFLKTRASILYHNRQQSSRSIKTAHWTIANHQLSLHLTSGSA